MKRNKLPVSQDDFKDTFLKLTEYTIPFKHESN
jgi:hypothetical protein